MCVWGGGAQTLLVPLVRRRGPLLLLLLLLLLVVAPMALGHGPQPQLPAPAQLFLENRVTRWRR